MKTDATKRSVVKKTLAALILSSLTIPVMMLQDAKAQGTKAGVTIGNQATAKYKDVNLNSFKASSNLVTTIIDNVFNILITQGPLQDDNSQQASPVQAQNSTSNTVVYYPYVLTNIGNAPDTYTMKAIASQTNPAKPLTNLKLFIDNDGDGRVSVGDIEIPSSSPTTPTLNPDQSLKLVVQYQIPLNAVAAEKYAVDLVGSSDGSTAPGYTKGAKTDGTYDGADLGTINASDENFNVTTIVTNAVVAITKSVDHSTANPLDELIYTFKLDNTGNNGASYIKFTDNIPANTKVVMNSGSVGVGTWKYWDAVDGGGSQTAVAADVKSVTFEMGDINVTDPLVLPAANSRVVSFKVQVTATAPAGTIPNNADYSYDNESGNPVGPQSTNIVTTDVNKKSAVAISPADPAYNPILPFAGTGDGTLANDAAASDATTLAASPAGTYIFYKNVVTNNGNANDSFNIEWDPSSTLPAGANVTFFRISDTSNGGINNNLPLLDTNNDGKIDTGLIPPHINADGSTNPNGQVGIVAKVFIPSDATGGAYTAVVKATSSNGGSPVGATPTQALSDTTRDVVTAITAPALGIYNIIKGLDDPAIPVFTESQDGATVSFPIDVWNEAGPSAAPDTYNLSASFSSGNIPGATVQFFPLKASTTLAVAALQGANQITLTSAASVLVGDKITLNGQTLDVYGVSGNIIQFGIGQTLAAGVGINETVVTSAPAPVSSTGVLNAGGGADSHAKFLAVVSIPKGTTPQTDTMRFTQTSNNDGANKYVDDTFVIPEFRDFKLETNRAGSAPAGGVLFYDHIITNTGNVKDTYKINLPPTGSNHGLSYQIIDQNGNPVGATTYDTPIDLNPGDTYTFKVKVTIPQGTPNNTVDTEIVSATNISGTQTTKTNTDITSVVDGFLSLVKSVRTLTPTAATPAIPADIKDPTGAKADPLDILEYTITFTNIGSSDAIESIIEDIIPPNTTYKAGSLKVNFTGNLAAPTDASGDDIAEEDNVAKVVRFRVGTAASALLGGTVSQGKSGSVTFRVTVD